MISKVFRSVLIFVLGFATLDCFSQTHAWVNQLPSGQNGDALISGQIVDDESNIYITGTFKDTLYLQTDTFYYKSGNTRSFYIVKYDSSGKEIWAKAFNKALNVIIDDLALDQNNELVLLGRYGGSTLTLGNFTLNQSRGIFVAFLDKSGTFTGAKIIAYGSSGSLALSLALDSKDNIYASIYLNGFGSGWVLNDSASPQNGSGFKHFVVKYNSTAEDLKWFIQYDFNDVDYIKEVAVDKNEEIYYTAEAEPNVQIHGTTVGSSGGNFIVRLDSKGNYKDKLLYDNGNYLTEVSTIVAVDSTEIYIAGLIGRDSLVLLNDTIRALDSSTFSARSFNFVAQLNGFKNVSWHRSTNYVNYNGALSGRSFITKKGDFLFFSSTHFKSFQFGSLSTKAGAKVEGIVSKLDRLGNVLWILPVQTRFIPLVSPIGDQDLIYCGAFTGTMDVKPFQLSNSSSTKRSFFGRTFDYTITRGFVNSGPYCAGDSFAIPFTKQGEYDTSNFFIAELSNENGEFFGGQRELGRIKTTSDSIIQGVLPLVRVASSNKYRIRIRSTSPVVQSFFKLDTLNLLIYSTDKADPGPDTSVCFNAPLKLNTYGGTTWKWSPNYQMDDSTLRTPIVRPLVDTTYTIIIGDSSGCGAPDTADIRVSVIKPPRFTQQSQTDSFICIGNQVRLYNSFESGKNPVVVNWFDEHWDLIITNDSLSTEDSLSIQLDSTTTIYAVVTDSCSPRMDTLQYHFALFAKDTISPFLVDTTVCNGQEVSLFPSLVSLNPDSLTYQWSKVVNKEVIGSDSVLTQSFTNSNRLELRITNSCLQDTFKTSFRVIVLQKLKGEILSSAIDSLCYGQEGTFYARSNGGLSKNSITYQWLVNNDTFTNDSFNIDTKTLNQLFPNQRDFNIRLITKDGCSAPNDTVEKQVFLYPPLEIQNIANWDTFICVGSNFTTTVQSTGGRSPILSKWSVDDKKIGVDSTITISADSFDSGSVIPIKINISDGCSTPDSLVIPFIIRDSLQARISSLPISSKLCSGESFIFQAQTNGGNTDQYEYSWIIDSDTFKTTTNQFNYSGLVNNTFKDTVVTLTLILSDGCTNYTVSDVRSFTVSPSPVVSILNDSTNRKQTGDTLLCQGVDLLFDANTFYSETNEINWFVDGVFSQQSAAFTFQPSQNAPIKKLYFITAVTTDNCTDQRDTLKYTVRYRDSLSTEGINDTLICYGSSVQIEGKYNGGFSPSRTVTWIDESTNSIIGNDSKLSITEVRNGRKIRAVLSDNCSVNPDTSRITISVLDTITASITSTEKCIEDNAFLVVAASGGTGNYSYKWTANSINLIDTAASIRISPKNITTYGLAISDGCTSPDGKAELTIGPIPKFTSDINDTTVCEPWSPFWNAKSLNGDNYAYQLFNQNTGSVNSLNEAISYNEGNYGFSIISNDGIGCSDTLRVNINVKPLPISSFKWTPDELNFITPVVTKTADDENADSYRWFFEETEIGSDRINRYNLSEVGDYLFKLITTKEGCSDSTSEVISYVDRYRYLEVTGFSPNGDGINDYFKPYLEGAKSYTYQIFNRWGERLYSGSNITDPWDGNYMNKPSPRGVYVVIIEAIDVDNIAYQYGVNLHLVR